MDMKEVIELVNTNRGTGQKENLNRMTRLMELLGNPQKELKFVHIAGTNGKGSTSAFMESVLRTSGIKTGLYTSPHLVRLNERIRINGEEIKDEQLIQITESVRGAVEQVEKELEERLYAFEILTAVAFLYFQDENTELVVLETGVGGKLDATNVIDTSEAAIITAIGLDHVKVLGDTLEEIAGEKAGIIKENGTVVTHPQPAEIEQVFDKRCKEKKAEWVRVSQSDITIKETTVKRQRFDYKQAKDIVIRMIGEHQVYNAAAAIEAAWKLQGKGWPVTDSHIKEGVQNAFWPGRMEKVLNKPLVILDGAHNLQGIEMLRKNLDRLFPNKKLVFLAGMMQDKEYRKMMQLMEEKAKRFLFLAPNSERAMDAKKMKEEFADKEWDIQTFNSPEEAADYIRQALPREEVLIVFGSLYLVGDMRKALFGK